MKTYGEIDMNDYDPQASLEAHQRIEAQRAVKDGESEIRVLSALVVGSLLVVVLTALMLFWAVQITLGG